VYGKLPGTVLEIIYANSMTVLAGSLAVVLQGGFEQICYTRSLKFIVVALVVVSIGRYLNLHVQAAVGGRFCRT
jgi:hypothetical protein